MKKLITIYILLAMSIVAYSQAFQANYTYDANGNRTVATIIWLSSSLKSGVVDLTELEFQDIESVQKEMDTIAVPQKGYTSPNIDTLAGTKITIYPNPTHGVVLVELVGFDEVQLSKSQQTITVYNLTGSIILQLTPLSHINSLNLLSQPAGTYELVIQIGTLLKTYTLIKN